ncbi:SRPBCC family protein [Nocardioides sp. YIM 152315]|uniref:SRPBCC family protein n=1 Tax=Nocardioides sp. YIM 152315 TaxID=3031760 RepID=UPI0023DB7C09|nr:SRPBCC family protein [Nocardioides sp. YIM 152315]MDF1602302.1 SRPBCC family protein [Nocardioides sp. YIM 152315]
MPAQGASLTSPVEFETEVRHRASATGWRYELDGEPIQPGQRVGAGLAAGSHEIAISATDVFGKALSWRVGFTSASIPVGDGTSTEQGDGWVTLSTIARAAGGGEGGDVPLTPETACCTIWYMNRLMETRRHVDAPPSAVWEVLVDVARWPDWTPTVRSVERLDDGPLRVGWRAKVRQPRLPQALWQVTEVVDGRSFTWEATGPGLRTIARHVVVPDGGGSTVTLSIEQLGPVGAVAALAWRRLTQRYIELEAQGLEKRVTGTPAE